MYANIYVFLVVGKRGFKLYVYNKMGDVVLVIEKWRDYFYLSYHKMQQLVCGPVARGMGPVARGMGDRVLSPHTWATGPHF